MHVYDCSVCSEHPTVLQSPLLDELDFLFVCLVLIDILFPAAVGVQSTAVVIEDKERTCDSLLMCIVTVLSHGLRSGGGVGDVLRKPSKEVPHKGLNITLGRGCLFIRPVADGCSGNLFENNHFFPVPLCRKVLLYYYYLKNKKKIVLLEIR